MAVILYTHLCYRLSGYGWKPATAEIYSGHITDGQGNGVEYATIVLLQDEIQKAGTTTDNKGNFTMEAKAGTYKVIVRCIGYEPLQKNYCCPHPCTTPFR